MEKSSVNQNITTPSCTIREINKPNVELMAKAFWNFYKQTSNT